MHGSTADQNPHAGYRKGGAAPVRTLRAALTVFGEHGVKGAGARQIAEAAGADLPALKCDFDGKHGLYLACARAVVQRHHDRRRPQVTEACDALGLIMAPDEARLRLKSVVRSLAERPGGLGGRRFGWGSCSRR